MRICSVLGARPQFVKLAVICQAVSRQPANAPWRHTIIHTGQHYDPAVSSVLFEELGIPQPDHDLDVGSGSHFERWVTRRTSGPFRTRVITDCVIPSLHVDYKGTRIKQYQKEGRALRTETTINSTRDFYIGKSLRNFALRQIGFQANRRLLQVPIRRRKPYGGHCYCFNCSLLASRIANFARIWRHYSVKSRLP